MWSVNREQVEPTAVLDSIRFCAAATDRSTRTISRRSRRPEPASPCGPDDGVLPKAATDTRTIANAKSRVRLRVFTQLAKQVGPIARGAKNRDASLVGLVSFSDFTSEDTVFVGHGVTMLPRLKARLVHGGVGVTPQFACLWQECGKSDQRLVLFEDRTTNRAFR